jgi:predicted nucleotidyltransferase
VSDYLKRPYPRILRKNLWEEFFEKAELIAKDLSKLEGVVGITLTGGLSRDYADEYSEIDLIVYFEKNAFKEWLYAKAFLPEGDSKYKGSYVDIEYLCYEDELKSEWSHYKKWDSSYAKILYDPQELIKKLLQEKTSLSEKEKEELIDRYFTLYGAFFEWVVSQWVHREDYLAANHCLNTLLDSIIKMVFLVNGEFIPFEKWTLNFSYSLEWTPKNWEEKIREAMLVKKISEEEVKRRQSILSSLLKECKVKMLGEEAKELESIIEIKELEILRFLAMNKKVELTEFEKKFGLKWRLKPPIFALIRIEKEDDKSFIIFDMKKFKEICQGDMEEFLEWDKALIRRLEKEI